MKRQLLIFTATFSFVLGVFTAPAARSQDAPPRFDHQVRNDIFAGLAGDTEAMKRGLGVAAGVLKSDPNHAEAMVWLGSGRAFEAGQLFMKGDTEGGMTVWTEALKLMDRAVELAPNHAGVRIPRGATLAAATRNMPPEVAQPLIEVALRDYLRVYELQKNSLGVLSEHARGELYMGLADLSERAGKSEEWRGWARKVVETLPAGSPYSRRASVWLEKGTLAPAGRTCLGCHEKAQ